MRINKIARSLPTGARLSRVFETSPNDRHGTKVQFTATSLGVALIVGGLLFTASLGSIASEKPMKAKAA